MGMWIELGIFLLAFVFAAWQIHDLKQERLNLKRGAGAASEKAGASAPAAPRD